MRRIRRIGEHSSNWITNKFSRCSSETERGGNVWRNSREEEVPQLEAIQLGDQTAILLRSADALFTQLFMRSGDAYYVVGGHMALNELLQMATSIQRGL